jgi:hypothetical protein
MDEKTKIHFRKVLDQQKSNVRGVKDALSNVPMSEAARKHLQNAEFSMLHAMHEISWIGLDKAKAKAQTGDDNPSA